MLFAPICENRADAQLALKQYVRTQERQIRTFIKLDISTVKMFIDICDTVAK